MSDPEGYRFLPHDAACECEECERHRAATCTCTADNPCSEDEPTGCPVCDHMDIYEPCPRLGFGCGTGGNTLRCDCCTGEQWRSAGGAR